jgi:hypothetical protein
MTETPARRRITLATGITSLAGPSAVALSETGHLHVFASAPLFEMWLVATIVALGVGIGVLSIYRGAKVAGVFCLLTNTPVLPLYGCIAAFFTLGGTR